MKQIQVEAITTVETIKPSTPTPDHLRRHNLSLFDQLEAPKYMNTILYFSSDPSKTRSFISNTLKTSLAKILSIYYPLAGRFADNNLYVDCHDQGVLYQETNVKGSLNDIISDLDPSELSKFLSYDMDARAGGLPLVVVQASFFECGGMVIGLRMYHKVGDALCLFTFLCNWASVARNNGEIGHITLPDFGSAAKLFPSIDLNGLKPMDNLVINEEDRVLRRFVFSNDTILGLCKKYSTSEKHGEFERRPSRVEALSAFLWKRYIASTQLVQHEKSYKVAIAVNMRTRVDPPLLPSVFGNIADAAVTIDTSPNEDDHYKLIKDMRTSMSDISDPENTKLYQSGVQLLPLLKEAYAWMNDSEKVVWMCFTSVCRLFRAGDVNFGWGPPLDINVYVPKMYGKNMCGFIDTVDGNGIQAWMCLNKEEMAKFEVDPQLLAHAYIRPEEMAKLG